MAFIYQSLDPLLFPVHLSSSGTFVQELLNEEMRETRFLSKKDDSFKGSLSFSENKLLGSTKFMGKQEAQVSCMMKAKEKIGLLIVFKVGRDIKFPITSHTCWLVRVSQNLRG